MTSRVVSAQVAYMFEDAEELGHKVDDIVEHLKIEVLFGFVPNFYFGIIVSATVEHIIPSRVDDSDLVILLLRIQYLSNKILIWK